MDKTNRDNFDYDRYARDVLGATDEDIPEQGMTQQQKELFI